ncbi:hypothetical protein RRG08_058329 [Elysia crispata]|uniref:Uncharacterized protein n=1 Tax=Elysia crispata TaxID=231223 RepID=A0AAE0XEI6_9GAST|nr:hypothetical protein RRG08_058329 [Elysia crispata]
MLTQTASELCVLAQTITPNRNTVTTRHAYTNSVRTVCTGTNNNTKQKHRHHETYLHKQQTPSPRDILTQTASELCVLAQTITPNRNTVTTGHTSGTKQKHPHHGTYLRYETETPSPRDIPPVPNRNTLTTGYTSGTKQKHPHHWKYIQ